MGIQAICGYAGCEVVELSVQRDHVHPIVMIPPKVAISDLMDRVKGSHRSSCSSNFIDSQKAISGKPFLVPRIGLNAEMIQKYVKYQEKKEQLEEQLTMGNHKPSQCGATKACLFWGLAMFPSWGVYSKSRPMRPRFLH